MTHSKAAYRLKENECAGRHAAVNYVFTLAGSSSPIEITSTGCGESLLCERPPCSLRMDKPLALQNTAAAAIPRSPAHSRKVFWAGAIAPATFSRASILGQAPRG